MMNPGVEALKGAMIFTFLIWVLSVAPFPFNVLAALGLVTMIGSLGIAVYKTRKGQIA